jgi:hypothetical protein
MRDVAYKWYLNHNRHRTEHYSKSLKIKQNTPTSLYLFHQNIRGFKNKMDELTCMLDSCDLSPHIICLSEHYLIDHNLLMTKPNNYYLASRFSCQSCYERCVRMYIKSNRGMQYDWPITIFYWKSKLSLSCQNQNW